MEQLKPETVNYQEKFSDKVLRELNLVHDEMMELMFQMGELGKKVEKGDLRKEETDSIISERIELAAQFENKRKRRERLEEQWRQASDREGAQKNNYTDELD